MHRFAVIGAGTVAQIRYVPALLDNPDASLDWVVDVNEERARRVASEAGSAQYATDHTDVLDEIDAVVLSTPPSVHEAIARDCIRAGVDIFTEKPVALSSQDAAELTELSSERGVRYAISRQYREAPACRLLHALVEQGAVGPIESVAARFGDETDWEFASAYRVTKQLAGGGVLADKGPHLLDVVRWILGEDLDVERYADDSYGGLEANAEIAFAVPGSGTTGTLEVTGSRDIANSIEVVGRDGRMRAEPGGTAVRVWTDSIDEETLVTTADQDPPTTSMERMARQVDRFVESLETETVSYVPAESGVHIMEIIENCYENREQLDHSWERVAVTDGGGR